MEERYGQSYSALYSRHWWWRARERFLVERLRKIKPKGGFGHILDVGCGDGLFLEALREFGEPEGLETDASLVTDAGHARGLIHVQPFDPTFQPGRQYGLILLLDVIEHIENDRACLARVLELLEPGGVALLTVPAFQALWTQHDELNRHYRRYSRESFRRLAEDVDFRIGRAEYFFRWLSPLKLAVRAREELARHQSPPESVPPRVINNALYLLSRLEQKSFGRLPIPFGTSLLVIGGRAIAA